MWFLLGCALHSAPPPITPPSAAGEPERSGTTVIDEGTLLTRLGAPQRPTLFSFWAAWCAPCLAELSTLALVAARRPDIDVVLVNLDLPGISPDKALVERGVTLESWQLASIDPSAAMARVLPSWDDSIPLTLLVLPDGSVSATFRGQATPDQILYTLPRNH